MKKLMQNNQFIADQKALGRQECRLVELPSQHLVKKTDGVLTVIGNRVLFTSKGIKALEDQS